jgi:hypothetical protein
MQTDYAAARALFDTFEVRAMPSGPWSFSDGLYWYATMGCKKYVEAIVIGTAGILWQNHPLLQNEIEALLASAVRVGRELRIQQQILPGFLMVVLQIPEVELLVLSTVQPGTSGTW